MSSSRSSLDSHCTLPTPAERAAARLNGVDLESQAYGGTDLREPPPPPPGEKGSKIEADLASQLGLPQGLVLTRAVQDKEYMLLSFDPRHTHPRDPMVRSVTSKYALTLFAAILVMNTALASSLPSGASEFISAELGGNPALVLSLYLVGYMVGPFVSAPLSETYGRRTVFIWGTLFYTAFTAGCIGSPNLATLLVLRFLSGAAGSVPTTNSAGVCADIWSKLERGTAMSYYSIATFAGPAIGPPIGAFLAVYLGWRYDFIVLAAFGALLFFLVVFFLPETYPPVILSAVARDLRLSTGNEFILSRLEFERMRAHLVPKRDRILADANRLLGRPFQMLFSEVIVMLLTVYMAFVYGLIYLLFEGYPVIFTTIHQIPVGYSSLPFLSTLVGAILSVPIALYFQRVYVRRVERNGGKSEPEMRLPAAQLGGVLVVVAFLWLGWAGYNPNISPVVAALSGIPQGIASILIFRSLQTYFIDAYEIYAASAIAANVVVRSAAGAGFPLFANAMFTKLGVEWACTLLAGIMLLLVPVPFYFERYGAQIRKSSKFKPNES